MKSAVSKYATKQGMEEKLKEFVEKGVEVYSKA